MAWKQFQFARPDVNLFTFAELQFAKPVFGDLGMNKILVRRIIMRPFQSDNRAD